ncbi:MAG: hypothetical protein C0490_13495 [Marivirga sp.]|nr:hypothetical protein [Marivirga sp.]
MAAPAIKAPLAIFVLWHPFLKEGLEYAEFIFTELKRDIKDPLARGMNIPVYFRYITPLLKIPFDTYEFVVVVALVDSGFVLDNNYSSYIKDIQGNSRNTLLIPVAIDKTAFNLSLGNANFARLYERENKKEYLMSVIAHETARHLYRLKEVIDPTSAPPAPLRLFISHAKVDGVDIARQIKAYVEGNLPLKTFFDANDIAIAYDFSKEIERYIEKAVVVAVHTDLYASREWCRKEILLAKEHNRPIVILNCFNNGESRSFPYMANVLTVHYASVSGPVCGDSSVWSSLITAVLKETVRLRYLELWIFYMSQKRNTPIDPDSISAYPPELVTVLRKRSRLNGVFLYPDPPLGTEELDILRQFENIRYITPTDL